MKNLKRALALALSSIMLVGMMAVGAGAASFGDAEDIKNTDAVNTMVALGVIKGDDKGNFDPERTVTRAEMAKMVCVALNGGTDPNLAGGGLYPDTKNHWAAGYIDYCTNMGIVSGDNHGNFNPDKTVTGTEAAKMMLMAMGYNAQTEKFVNDANWAININVLASTRGLYKNVASVPDAGLTRDNAAQLIFNGIQANMVKYELAGIVGGNGISQAVELNKTILSDRYNTYEKAPEGVMDDVTYVSNKEEWTYVIDGKSFTTDKDFTDLFGQNVRVIAEQAGDKEVYGIFAEDSSVIAEGYTSDLAVKRADDEIKVNGKTYDLDKTYKAIDFMTGTAADLTKDGAVKLIDTDDDNKVDTIVMVPFTFAKVTYVGKTSFTAGTSYKFEDVNAYEGIAKNDYVVITPAANTADDTIAVAQAEVQNGTVEGKKAGKYLIDGTWYTLADGVEELNVNDVIDYVVFGTVIYNAKVTDGETYTKDLAVVITAADTSDSFSKKFEAKLIFPDGSKKTVKTDKSYATDSGKLVTYYLNNDDEYVLKVVDGDNKAGYDGYAATAPTGSATEIKTIGGKDVADDAVIFVFKGEVGTANVDNNAKVISGKEAKDLAATTYTTGTMALNSKADGFIYTKVALLTSKTADLPDTFDGSNYGYLTADAYNSRKDGKTYRNLTIWNGTAEIVVREDKADLTGLVAGAIVAYDTVDADTVKNVKIVSTTLGAVTGWDGDEKIQIDTMGASTKVTADTTVLYIDSDKKDGVEGGSISIADEPKTGVYVPNVLYVEGTSELKLLVVDVNNKMACAGSDLADYPTTTEQIKDQYAAGGNKHANWYALGSLGLEQTVIGNKVYFSGKLTDILTLTAEDGNLKTEIKDALNNEYFTGITTPESVKTYITTNFGFSSVEKVGFVSLERNGKTNMSCVVYGTVSGETGVYTLKHASEGNTQSTFVWKSQGITCDISGLHF